MTVLAKEIYLDSYLAPIAPFLTRVDITDIYINQPFELWIETLGGTIERFEVPSLTRQILARLARQIAATSAQGISREHPLLAASLPDGSRVQVVLPPATRGEIAIAIRKHVVSGRSLDDYHDEGTFGSTRFGQLDDTKDVDVSSQAVNVEVRMSLRHAVHNRKNILISGGTSTGKTTFLNALLKEIPRDERIIAIEDTAELKLEHPNSVGLIAVRSAIGEANVEVEDLLIASLRMRPDRIILGEMRGKEALTFLRAINTGHPGSISTIHADSPESAIDQLALLTLQTESRLSWEDVIRYVRRSVDLIVQLKRQDGKRIVDQILAVQ